MLMEVCNKPTPNCYGGAIGGPGNPIAPAGGRSRLANREDA